MISGATWLSFLYPPLGSRMFLGAALFALASATVMIVWLLLFGIKEAEWNAADI